MIHNDEKLDAIFGKNITVVKLTLRGGYNTLYVPIEELVDALGEVDQGDTFELSFIQMTQRELEEMPDFEGW